MFDKGQRRKCGQKRKTDKRCTSIRLNIGAFHPAAQSERQGRDADREKPDNAV